MSLQRYDSGRLSKAGVSPSGGARLVARVARTGIQTYRMADGSTRREYRSPEEVFKPESLASFVGSVLTIGHPANAVTPASYAKDAAGTVIAPTRVKDETDGHEYIAALVDVNRADAIQKVDSGELVELSTGYRCDWDPTPGVVPAGEAHAGQSYDGRQINIVANHNAMLPEGRARAGRGAKFQTDSAELDADGNQLTDSIDTPKEHMKFIVDGIEYEAGPALQDAIKRAEAKTVEANTKAETANKAAATADAKADAADKAKTAALAQVTPAAISALVSDEIAFRASVSPILDEVDAKTKAVTAFKFDGKSRRDVKSAVIAKLGKTLKTDADDVYVSAYFDSAIEAHVAATKAGALKTAASETYVPPVAAVLKADEAALYLDEAAWAAHMSSFHGKDIHSLGEPTAKG